MKLYKISQNENEEYYSYISAIVAAESEDKAKEFHPSGDNKDWIEPIIGSSSWCKTPECVKVEYIGEACEKIESGVILSSIKAG